MEIGRSPINKLGRIDVSFQSSKRGKNKDSYGKKQFFFLFFVNSLRTGRLPAGREHPKPLLNKGFNLPEREFPAGRLEGLFPFPVEPPFGRRLFHQGIDIPHAHEIPDAP